MQPGACRTGYRLVFGVRRILVVIIEGVLNVKAGSRTGENESWHTVCSRKRGPDGRNPGLCQSERAAGDADRQLTRYKKSMAMPPRHIELDQKRGG
jgi:hypothetical protein